MLFPQQHARSSQILLTLVSVALWSTAGGYSNVNLLRGAAGLLNQRTGPSHDRQLLQAPSATAGRTPLVIAEGGAQYLYPEMTIRAYEEAMDNGADFVVCMLAITEDGQAICHPTFELSQWTNIDQYPELANRAKFRLRQHLGSYSFNFTLAEILTLRVNQTKPETRTKAFDGRFPVATPQEVIDALRRRAAAHPTYKRVSLILEINDDTEEMESQGIGPSPVSYAISLLKSHNWTTPASPAMVVSKRQQDLASFVKEGVMVQRLLRFLPKGPITLGSDIVGLDITTVKDVPGKLSEISKDATGVMLHVSSILYQRKERFWGQPIPRVYWDNATLAAARGANLSSFVWGFTENDWSSTGANFNTFLSDPVAMYRSLLYGAVGPLIAGVATDWPAAAAKTAACYRDPVPLFQPKERRAKGRPLIIASGGSAGLVPPHTNLSYLQAIKEGADFIDCILQVSRDGVLFCLENMQLRTYTNVDSRQDFKGKETTHHRFVHNPEPRLDFWSFDLLWDDIKTLKVLPKTQNGDDIKNSRRPAVFLGTLPILSFDECISIARNASRDVGLYVKIDYPFYLAGLGQDKPQVPIDQIDLLLATLRRRGYLNDANIYNATSAPPLLVASYDSCGLQRLHNLSNGTLPLVQRLNTNIWDSCEMTMSVDTNSSAWRLSKPGLDVIKTYAGAVSPQKAILMQINNGTTGGALAGFISADSLNPVASDTALSVYPRLFRSDVAPGDKEGAYDFLSDPAMELQYYYDQLHVTGLEAQFVSTAAGFLESSCRPRAGFQATDPGFNMTQLHPGELAQDIRNYNLNSSQKGANGSSGIPPSPGGRDLWKGPGIVAAIAGGALAMAIALLALLFLACRKSQMGKRKRSIKDSLRMSEKFAAEKLFMHGQLLSATNHFSQANRLGKGGFGAVYKGILADGSIVAIKKLHMDLDPDQSIKSNDSARQLINEADIIGTIHNRNVVPLKGICLDKELLLVYDYMPNGSLQDAIFKPDYPIQLDWRQWFNIAVGTAKGLAYLHEGCEHKILHRDIKPANILIDAQLNARVADFGLARNLEVHESHITTKVMGSFGYMAPEYVASGQLTERSDTYSFGMVIMTIITGRSPLGDQTDSTTSDWVKRKAEQGPDQLLSVIHPKFEGQFDEGEALRGLYTAILCVQYNPAMRPSMGEAVQMLLGEREIPQRCWTPGGFVSPDSQQSNFLSQDPRFSQSSSCSIYDSGSSGR